MAFEVIGYISVLSNVGIVVFTSQDNFFGIYSRYGKLCAFVVIEVRVLR